MKGQGQGVVKIELSRRDSTYPNPKPRGNLAYIELVAIKNEGEKEMASRRIGITRLSTRSEQTWSSVS
jgi:hypothetical protein